MLDILFSPYKNEYKSTVGSVLEKTELTFKILINKNFNIWNQNVQIYHDNLNIKYTHSLNYVKCDDAYKTYNVTFCVPDAGLYWYFFEFEDCYGKHYVSCDSDINGFLSNTVIPFQLSIHKKMSSSIYNGKIIYQIMTDRFCDGGVTYHRNDIIMHEKWDDTPFYTPIDGKILNNDFFGGDLRGIIKKLDYLVSLNVGIIYLNPIFKAYSNHKYDTGNYFEIDPMFGTKEDFIELVSQAKKRNISIILDGVFNHTGSDSLYFNKDNNYISLGAYQSKDSPYYNWYKFKSFPDSYESWWGFSTLPALNDKNPDLVKFFTGENGVVDYWLKLGASGFRLDVVDELSESFLLEIVKRAKQTNPDALIVGEVWEDASNKIAYGSRRSYLNGEQLTSVMNYPLRDAILDYLQNHNSFAVRNCMRILTNNYPKQILDNLMNILSTHDTVRLLTAFSNVDFSYLSRDEQANFALSHEEYYLARQKLKMATAMLYTLPGLPTIYYGDEAGLQGFKDPFCRRCMPWDNIDKTIYEWYRVLGDIRKEDVLKDGEYSEDVCENGVFSFIRKKGNNQLITIINNSNYEYIYHLDLGYDIIEKVIIENVVTIPKLGVKIIKVVKDA